MHLSRAQVIVHGSQVEPLLFVGGGLMFGDPLSTSPKRAVSTGACKYCGKAAA